MKFKVIYIDGTAGIETTSIDELFKSDKIIAFFCSEGWIEVRRRSKAVNYFHAGIDRRKNKPETFFAKY